MKNILPTLLAALLFVGCDQKPKSPKSTGAEHAPQPPPVEIQVIAPAIEKQFATRFADGFAKVGKVRFDGSLDVYHVEVLYTEKDQEKRYVMELKRIIYADRPNYVVYLGTFPAPLLGDQSTADAKDFEVTIDEMMNEEDDSLAADLDRIQSPIVPPEAKPVASLIHAWSTSNLVLYKTFCFEELVDPEEGDLKTVPDKQWNDLLKRQAELWAEMFPGSKAGDFTYSYSGDKLKGEVTLLLNGKKVDPTMLHPLPVVFEKGSWKLKEIPGP